MNKAIKILKLLSAICAFIGMLYIIRAAFSLPFGESFWPTLWQNPNVLELRSAKAFWLFLASFILLTAKEVLVYYHAKKS